LLAQGVDSNSSKLLDRPTAARLLGADDGLIKLLPMISAEIGFRITGRAQRDQVFGATILLLIVDVMRSQALILARAIGVLADSAVTFNNALADKPEIPRIR
jgi:hypothetical protein